MAPATVRPFDHTGDVGFEVQAPQLETLFDGARRALLEVLLRTPPRSGSERTRLSLQAPGLDRLLLRWLDELLFLVQTRGQVPVGASLTLRPPIEGETGWGLTADLSLAPLDPRAQGWRGEVKAATYHGLELTREGPGWRARVILDV